MSGAASKEHIAILSSVSYTAREVEQEFLQHQQRRRYSVIKPFTSSPPEMGNADDGDLQCITGTSEPPPAPPPAKKKRSLPGTPDPSAEVIALSPTTLMATNRFVCEICHKGFQLDQNLQLHRRGHNLPWKLRQRSGGGAADGGGGPPRKRVYVCPEASCVHHKPARALGDLTGIKKHYCRKHGEKKWKCERCAKRYAVHSDWKAHSKVCGTRQYNCDCGTVFSRRDSFVTHRAFCDALAQEKNKLAQPPMNMATVASALQGQAAHHPLAVPSSLQQADDDLDDFGLQDTKSPHLRMLPVSDDANLLLPPPLLGMAGCMLSSLSARSMASSPAFSFNGSNKLGGTVGLDGPPADDAGMGFSTAGSAAMSATALLQKAAEMGATTSVYGSAGFSSAGFGTMLSGPGRIPTISQFGPVKNDDGLPLPQLVGFDVGGLSPGQLYSGGSMTTTIGSLLNGGLLAGHQRPDDKRVVDYMGVDDHHSLNGVDSPFGSPMGPWS